jgi:hypothetical protein
VAADLAQVRALDVVEGSLSAAPAMRPARGRWRRRWMSEFSSASAAARASLPFGGIIALRSQFTMDSRWL